MSNTNISRSIKAFKIAKTPGYLSELGANGRPIPNTEGIDHTLNQAHERGIENLIIPTNWPITNLDEWESRSKGSTTSFTIRRKDDKKAVVRLWRLPSGADPELYREALLRMLRADPGFTTGGGLAVRYLLAPNKANTPKWILEGQPAVVWRDSMDNFNAMNWGSSLKDRRELSLTQYDRNKSYLPAISQAIVAPLWIGENYQHYDDDAPVSKSLAGMYRVEIPEWPLQVPSVYGNATPGDRKWVDSVMVRFVEELRVKYPEIPEPVIFEAYLAPAHKTAALQQLVEKNKELLAEFSNTREEQMVAKGVYKAAAGAIASLEAHRQVYRPDWAAAIKMTSWVNVLRAVYKEWEADSRFVPVALNVDAVYYPADLPTPSTLKIGTGLGQYKLVTD